MNVIIGLGSVAGAILSLINLSKQIIKLISTIRDLISKIEEYGKTLKLHSDQLEELNLRLYHLESSRCLNEVI